jgi:hypothetical protein
MCHAHKARWLNYTNVMQDWRNQTWADWDRNIEFLNGYTAVEEYYHSEEEEKAEEAAHEARFNALLQGCADARQRDYRLGMIDRQQGCSVYYGANVPHHMPGRLRGWHDRDTALLWPAPGIQLDVHVLAWRQHCIGHADDDPF